MWALIALFFLTALAYASVGFGGGSTYTALLLLRDVDFTVLPAISLTCNIIVVTGGIWRYHRSGFVKWKRLLPLCLISVPMAWLGGRLLIPQPWFIGLLAIALFISALLLLWDKEIKLSLQQASNEASLAPSTFSNGARSKLSGHKIIMPLLCGAIGLLSGIVGIGGGIFLAPILYLMRWGRGVEIAPLCSAFIFVNSIAGLAGQVQKLETGGTLTVFSHYWPLFPAVLLGGQIGTLIGRDRFSDVVMRRITGVLILVVVMRLILSTYF